ncbi:MAG: hypothetical protein IJK61_02665 [Bacteroidetes bacterium]|nr:hypothetical protein [Bacteroidota bacterium]
MNVNSIMKKLILILCLPFILFSCSNSKLDTKGFVTAYEGYQLLIVKMTSLNYDTDKINLVNLLSFPNTLLSDVPFTTAHVEGTEDFTAKLSFSGKDIGKSNFWGYTIKYDDQFFYGVCLIKDGKPMVDIYHYNAVIKEDLQNKYINLTKEIDSPIFIKKLSEYTDFLKEYKPKDNDDFPTILLGYVSPEQLENDINIHQNNPYWSIGTIRNLKILLLLADNNIKNNKIITAVQKPL